MRSLRYVLLIVTLVGCVAVPRFPDDPELFDPPVAAANSAVMIITRKDEFPGGAITISILLDGLPVANLDEGQFTKFLINPGEHTLSIGWEVGGVWIIYGGGFSGGAGLLGNAGPFEKDIRLQVDSSSQYLFTIQHRKHHEKYHPDMADESKRFLFGQVERFDEEFAPENLEFRPPGKNQTK